MLKLRAASTFRRNTSLTSWLLASGLLIAMSGTASANSGPAPSSFFARCYANMDPDDILWCRGYVEGIADALADARAICPPPTVNAVFAAVFVAQETHAAMMQDRPENFVARALMRRFPCRN
jgi:Rap1a immunity proteins